MKKIVTIVLAVMTMFVFFIMVSAEAGVDSLMSRFSKEKIYSGAYIKNEVFYIATTDVGAFEILREKLSKNEKYAGKALSELIFIEAKYAYNELKAVIERIWEKAEELKVESSWVDQENNMIMLQVLNPDKNTETHFREIFDFENIKIEPVYREFVNAGKGWEEAVIKTETNIKYDKNGKMYTGWTKTKSGKRYYYKNGVRLTGVHEFKSGAAYVFDQDGLFLDKRNAGQYNVKFDDGYNVNINDGEISFTVSGFKTNDPSGSPYFSLYVYENGKWKQIPYNTNSFDSFAIGANNGKMTFSQPFSMFYCDFKPGLYRIKAEVWEGERDENGKAIDKTVYAEFNIIAEKKKSQIKNAPQLMLMFNDENEKSKQKSQASQLTTSWGYTDENGNGEGYDSCSVHALQLSDYNDCTLKFNADKGKILLSFTNDYLPESVSVKRWNKNYYMGNRYDENSLNKNELIEVTDNIINIKNDKNDYIYEVYAKWEQGSSYYAFLVENVL